MANMNLKDALERSLLATKEYIDKNKFSRDYNDLENRPVYEELKEGAVVISYDGNNDGKEIVRMNSNQSYVKISNNIPTKEEITNAIFKAGDISIAIDQSMIIDITEDEDSLSYVIMIEFSDVLIDIPVIFKELTIEYATFNAGIWYPFDFYELPNFNIEYEGTTREIKQLEEKFIPHTIARVENLPYCDTRTTKPATITYDGNYLSKQIAVLYEMTRQIECLVRIHDSLSFTEESDIVAITLSGNMTEGERIDDLVIRKHNENVTSIKTIDGIEVFLLNIKSDTILNISDIDISVPVSVEELFLSEGLWAFHLAIRQDLKPVSLSLEENNEANAKGLGEYYICEVEYNKTIKGNVKRVDRQDHLTTKKYVDDAIIKDYNDLENRPCYDSYMTVEYIYDGDFVGKPTASSARLVKVSDDVVTYEEFKSATVIFKHDDGWITTYNMSSRIEDEDYYFSDDRLCLCSDDVRIVYEDDVEFEGITYPQKGIYFYDSEAMVNSSSNGNAKLIVGGRTYSLSIKRKEFKQLDEKFIPDTIATKKYVDDVVANATPAIITEADINAIIADIDN